MTNTQHRIDPAILSILAHCTVIGEHLALPPGQLDRKTYEAVNKVLDLMGGKWSRTKKVHVFPESPADLLDTVLLTGEITDTKKLFQQFYTPVGLADHCLELADPHLSQRWLEPSAGKGVFLQRLLMNYAFRASLAIELDPVNIPALQGYADEILHGDFLMFTNSGGLGRFDYANTRTFDRIVMNPPFTRGQDVKHILHARNFLKPTGLLVAICANGPREQELLQPLADHWEVIPAGAFAESGTNISTAVLRIRA